MYCIFELLYYLFCCFKVIIFKICILFTKLSYYECYIRLGVVQQIYQFFYQILISFKISFFIIVHFFHYDNVCSFYKNIDRVGLNYIFLCKKILCKRQFINFQYCLVQIICHLQTNNYCYFFEVLNIVFSLEVFLNSVYQVLILKY